MATRFTLLHKVRRGSLHAFVNPGNVAPGPFFVYPQGPCAWGKKETPAIIVGGKEKTRARKKERGECGQGEFRSGPYRRETEA